MNKNLNKINSKASFDTSNNSKIISRAIMITKTIVKNDLQQSYNKKS